MVRLANAGRGRLGIGWVAFLCSRWHGPLPWAYLNKLQLSLQCLHAPCFSCGQLKGVFVVLGIMTDSCALEFFPRRKV